MTITEIASHLNVTRKTAQARLDAGLSADDMITLARALHVDPVAALVELDKLTYAEVFEWMDSDGTLLTTATDAQLALELAERLNPELGMARQIRNEDSKVRELRTSEAPDFATMAARKSRKSADDQQDD
ncbi:hypothetical protein A6F58_00540 [Prescottella equi]|nr:hypothetical protein A6F58_00540 [Prescottella equi]